MRSGAGPEEPRPAEPPLVDVGELRLLGLRQLAQEPRHGVELVAPHPEDEGDEREQVPEQVPRVELGELDAREDPGAAGENQQHDHVPVAPVEEEVVVQLRGADDRPERVELTAELEDGQHECDRERDPQQDLVDQEVVVPLAVGQVLRDREQQRRADAEEDVTGHEAQELLPRRERHESCFTDEPHEDHAHRGEQEAEQERDREVVAEQPVERAEQIKPHLGSVVHVSPFSVTRGDCSPQLDKRSSYLYYNSTKTFLCQCTLSVTIGA